MTQEERLIVSAYTGVPMTDWNKILEYVSEVLGIQVSTYEELTFRVVREVIKEAVKDKFLALCG